MRHLALLALTLCVAPPLARAQRPGGDSGWRELLDPERAEARRLVRQGLGLLVTAMQPLESGFDDAKWVVLDRALLRFARARRALPDDAELAYYTAYALSEWQRPDGHGAIERRDLEAIEAWHRLRALDADYVPALVANHLAMLHMRRHELDEARAEYATALSHVTPPTVELAYRFYLPSGPERALELLFATPSRAQMDGNLAEVLMLSGDSRGAIAHYRAAFESPELPETRALAAWGLALAHERGGDHASAIEWAMRAVRADPIPPDDPRFRYLRQHAPFGVLHLEGVFFEPAYEIHAYEALGHEAIAVRTVDPEPAHLADALRSWRAFLVEGGSHSRFAAQAHERVEALEAAQAAAPAPRTLRPRR